MDVCNHNNGFADLLLSHEGQVTMPVQPTNDINNASQGKASAIEFDRYEHLRSWYLAHLRKSQLVNEVSKGITPVTLIKRDQAALEKLISEAAVVPSLEVRTPPLRPKIDLPKPGPVIFSFVVSLLMAVSLLARNAKFIDEFSLQLITTVLLMVLCGVLYWFARELHKTRVKLASVTHHEYDIADFAYEAFWSIDNNYKLLAVNPTFERMLGVQKFCLLGDSLLDFIPASEVEYLKQRLGIAREKMVLEKFEIQILKSNNTAIDLELTAEYSPSDSLFYCIAIDISERKSIERLKEQLMDMLSHDLRTPLSSLAFSLTLLGTSDYGNLMDEGQALLKVAESNVTNLIDLINQLLDLHKLDSKQLQLYVTELPVASLIQPALQAIENLAEKKNIDITIDADEFMVRVDKERIQQVLINLLSNAIKYSPEGGEVKLLVKKLPGEWLAEFRVVDSGPGIDKKHLQFIFDRFYRVPASDGNNEPGTGLGLAICKAIVEAHGGTIYVETEPQNGSSFFCHLPAVKERSKK